jgi:hypothetical protein
MLSIAKNWGYQHRQKLLWDAAQTQFLQNFKSLHIFNQRQTFLAVKSQNYSQNFTVEIVPQHLRQYAGAIGCQHSAISSFPIHFLPFCLTASRTG